MKKKSRIIAICVSSFILILEIVLSTLVLFIFDDVISEKLIGFDVDMSAVESAKGDELAEQIEAEGMVLVKNDSSTLPLNKNEKNVNVFGFGASDWVHCGSGSGRTVESLDKNKKPIPNTDLLKALEEYGVNYNKDLIEFYEKFAKERPHKGDTLHSWYYEYYRLIEPSMGQYSDKLLDNAKAFSNTAIVVIGRVAGESSDAPKVQYKGLKSTNIPDDASRTYLEVSKEEEELLEYCGRNYENVVVLINSLNTMELGFLDTIEGLDSCIIVGGTGNHGARAIPKVLYGDINPSGKLSDTYAYDLKTNPSYPNSGLEGERMFNNTSSKMYPIGIGYGNVSGSAVYKGLSYVDYEESIYLGYKWYETADKEGYFDDVENEYGKGYDGVVQYPFGYGLSYGNDFSWEIIGLSHKNNTQVNKDDEIEIKLRVTNNSDTISGSDVVEIYYTAPYRPGEIEKSAINLAAFAKTEVLKPHQFQDLTLKFNVRDMASYDCYDINKNGFTGYEVESGVYEIKLMKDAHTPHEVISSGSSVYNESVLSYKVDNNFRYETDDVTGNQVYNRFTGEDSIDGAPIDGGSRNGDVKSPLKFLTRKDGFKNSFPTLKPARSITTEQLEYNLYTKKHADEWKNKNSNLEPVTYKVDSGLKIFDRNEASKIIITELGLELGNDFYSEKWEALLNQMSFEEMTTLTLHGYTKTSEVTSIGKPKCLDVDGPAQIGSFNVPERGTGFPNATVMAQTWNQRLAYSFGRAIGIEAKGLGYDGWYGPGINMHRSPFGGRNYEYYSEDAYLTGVMGAESVRGAKNAGVYCYLKHLAVYDQEEYRDGLYTFLNEQALREIYLKPFKIAIHNGGATGIMTSYNRLGCIWAGGSSALLEGVVREEWGFNGTILTDYSDHQQFMSMDHAIRSGGDLWMDGWLSDGKYKFETTEATASNAFKHALRDASKHIIYTLCNAYYTNSIYNENSEDKIEIGAKAELNESWKTYVYVIDGVIILGLGLWVGLTFKKGKKKDSVEV